MGFVCFPVVKEFREWLEFNSVTIYLVAAFSLEHSVVCDKFELFNFWDSVLDVMRSSLVEI